MRLVAHGVVLLVPAVTMLVSDLPVVVAFGVRLIAPAVSRVGVSGRGLLCTDCDRQDAANGNDEHAQYCRRYRATAASAWRAG